MCSFVYSHYTLYISLYIVYLESIDKHRVSERERERERVCVCVTERQGRLQVARQFRVLLHALCCFLSLLVSSAWSHWYMHSIQQHKIAKAGQCMLAGRHHESV